MTTVNNTLEQTLEQAKNLPLKKFDVYIQPLGEIPDTWIYREIEARLPEDIADWIIHHRHEITKQAVRVRVYRKGTGNIATFEVTEGDALKKPESKGHNESLAERQF